MILKRGEEKAKMKLSTVGDMKSAGMRMNRQAWAVRDDDERKR